MRQSAKSVNGEFQVFAVAGTHTVLMAMNCAEHRLKGLRGFGFLRKAAGETDGKWLRSLKVFRSVVPDPSQPVNGKRPVFTTEKHPVQSFLWSDYTARAQTRYEFTIVPMYGAPGALQASDDDRIHLVVETEAEDDASGHGIWFNRGAIASQYFAAEFGDVEPTTEQLDNLGDPLTKWLSRGLAEACKRFIDDVPAGEALRGCVYEFTYTPILLAFKAALERGVDVKIAYHGTDANDKAIDAAGLPRKIGARQILFPRTVPKIPHNKFIVRVTGGKAVSVWTGSTNITSSGFLGQSNVGHRVNDPATAATYLEYWKGISQDPGTNDARALSTRITPHPVELPPKDSITVVFSPRYRAAMLQWYANRMLDACQSIMFTAAFGVNEKLVLPLAQDRDFLRFVLMEKRPAKEMEARLRADRDVVISYGAVLGEVTSFEDGQMKRHRIKEFGLDRWFRKEEHYRKAGNIFFVHTKFLLVDPLSDDPLVCTGSANFSDGSLTSNDENMLLIRGNKRVADIYLTEFDRIFRHFYFRDVANEIELRGGEAEGAFLDETDEGPKHWTNPYFTPGAFKTRRREMFFADVGACWAAQAAQRPKDETARDGDTPTKGRKTVVKKAPAKKTVKKRAAAKKATKKAVRKPAKKKAAVKKTARKAVKATKKRAKKK